MKIPPPKKRNVPFHLQALGYRVTAGTVSTYTMEHPDAEKLRYYPITIGPGPDLTLGECIEMVVKAAYTRGYIRGEAAISELARSQP